MEIHKQWCVKITKDNIKELEAWRIKQPDVNRNYSCKIESWLVSYWYDKTYLSYSYRIPGLYIQITIEKFREYTTKKSIKKRIKLLKI